MERKAEWCYVGDTEEDIQKKKYKRMFVADVGGDYPIVTVNLGGEEDYIQGSYFATSIWQYCEMIEEPEAEIVDTKHPLTKREYIATMLIQGMFASKHSFDDSVSVAVKLADKLIEALENGRRLTK